MKSPHEKMTAFDKKAEAYWLANINLVDGTNIKQADVLSHSEAWLCVRVEGDNEATATWINATHLVSFDLLEG